MRRQEPNSLRFQDVRMRTGYQVSDFARKPKNGLIMVNGGLITMAVLLTAGIKQFCNNPCRSSKPMSFRRLAVGPHTVIPNLSDGPIPAEIRREARLSRCCAIRRGRCDRRRPIGMRDRRVAGMRPPREGTGVVLVLFAAALWATVGVGARLVPAATVYPPEFLGFARTAIAGPVILSIALVALGPRAALGQRPAFGDLVLFAASNAVFQIGLFRSFAALGVNVTVFLTVCLPPVLALLRDLVRQREPVARGSFLALALAVAGLVLIAADRNAGPAAPPSSDGLAAAILASVAFVTMSDAARSLSRRTPPLMIAGLGLSLSSAIILTLLPFISTIRLASLPEALSDPTILWLAVYLGLGPTALAYVCYCKGIAACRSALVALIASMIEPAIATGLALWVLTDRPFAPETLGCAVLMLAMLVLWHSERELARRTAVTVRHAE
jgi:DME family drug/metabolite transporter